MNRKAELVSLRSLQFVYVSVFSQTHLSALKNSHPAPGWGPGCLVLIRLLQEAAWCVKVHSPEGIL